MWYHCAACEHEARKRVGVRPLSEYHQTFEDYSSFGRAPREELIDQTGRSRRRGRLDFVEDYGLKAEALPSFGC